MAVKIVVQKQENFFGGLPSFTAPDAEGILFINDGQTQMIFANTHATNPNSYIVQAGRGYLGTGFKIDYPEPDTNENGVIPANAFTNSSFFAPQRFNRGDGMILVVFSAITDITIAAVRVQDAAQGGLV